MVINHFDRAQNTGFIRVMGSCDARRQLHFSAAVVVIMAVAAVALVAMPRLPRDADNPTQIKLIVHPPQPAHFEPATLAVS
jgi:hypothetical protein